MFVSWQEFTDRRRGVGNVRFVLWRTSLLTPVRIAGVSRNFSDRGPVLLTTAVCVCVVVFSVRGILRRRRHHLCCVRCAGGLSDVVCPWPVVSPGHSASGEEGVLLAASVGTYLSRAGAGCGDVAVAEVAKSSMDGVEQQFRMCDCRLLVCCTAGACGTRATFISRDMANRNAMLS